MNPSQEKQLYQAAFAGSLGYLFIAIFVVGGPTYLFGLIQTALAVFACVVTWRALVSAKKRAAVASKMESASTSLAARLADLEEARKKGLISEDEYQTKRAQVIATA